MESEIRIWLADIKKAISEINQFLPAEKNFLLFQQDLKTIRAVERNLEIIGEAINRILKVEPAIQITHARRIVDTRNRIIHGYDTVSEDIIWAIVIRELPNLELEALLKYNCQSVVYDKKKSILNLMSCILCRSLCWSGNSSCNFRFYRLLLLKIECEELEKQLFDEVYLSPTYV